MKGFCLSLFLVALVVDSSQALVSGHKVPSISLQNQKISSSSLTTLSLTKKSSSPIVNVNEFSTSPGADGFSIGTGFIGQSILVGSAFAIASLYSSLGYGNIGFETPSFDTESFKTALLFAAPLTLAGLAFNNLPISSDIIRDKKFYLLRILGRQSSVITTFFITLALAAAGGFSEELFFRGVVQNMIENSSSFPIALAIASSIYGLIHIPLFGSNAVEKGLLGAAMGYAYYISGHNLAVPIAMHTIYDAVTGFITWNVAKNDLNTRMLTAVKNEVKRIQTVSSSEIDELSAAIFDMLDFNQDGQISLSELDAGLKLYGNGMIPMSAIKNTADIFNRADTDKNGTIDVEEFKSVVREDMKNIGAVN